jgi:hypothetical protein
MISIETQVLTDAVDFLEQIPSQQGIPSAQFVRVRASKKNNKLFFTLAALVTGETVVRYTGPRLKLKRELCLDRRLLFPFIAVAKFLKSKAKFEVEVDKSTVKIRHGRRAAKLESTADVVGYSTFPGKKQHGYASLPVASRTLKLLRCASACASADPSIPHLNCVFIRKSGEGVALILSSNEITMYKTVLGDDTKIADSIAFPLALVPFLRTEGLKQILWRKDCALLSFSVGWVWQTISAQAKVKFPADFIVKCMHTWRHSLPPVFSVSCQQLSDVAARLSQYLASVRRLDWALEVRGREGEKKLKLVSTLPQCCFTETLFVEKPLREDVCLFWPLHVLMPVFEFLGTEFKKKNLFVHTSDSDKDPYILRVGDVEFAVVKLAKTLAEKK